MKRYLFGILCIVVSTPLIAQHFISKPIPVEKSHADLYVESVEITEQNTIVSISVHNKLDQGGWFCASEKISLQISNTDITYNIIQAENIPTCPDRHEFTEVGEILNFKLIFPPISKNVKIIDIVENCDQACFFFKGLIIDQLLIDKINLFEKGLDLVTNEKLADGIPFFEKVLDGDTEGNLLIFGLSYYYLVICYSEIGDIEKAREWYDRLNETNLPDKVSVLNKIDELDIF